VMAAMPIELARPMPIDLSRIGIKTRIHDIEFRSRLEARWALMFEAFGWPWNYEPIDLAGYIPDYIVSFRRAPLLVEVKPALTFEELNDATAKIIASGWRHDFLVVGTTLFRPSGSHEPSIGLLGLKDRNGPPGDEGWLKAGHAIAIECLRCQRVSVKHYTDAWFCISCGAMVPKHDFGPVPADHLQKAWDIAGRESMWRPAV
jgi:hypothetical protein